MKLKDLLNRKISILKKIIILRREIKKRGGEEFRKESRFNRLKSIRSTKESIQKDLIRSWTIGELKSPDVEDWKRINIPYKEIPINFLVYLKKKYWGGNIYNEL